MPNMSLEKVKMPEQDPNVRNKNFEEVSLGYTKEQAMELSLIHILIMMENMVCGNIALQEMF